jgi:Astacin (Peptidase family M12A)
MKTSPPVEASVPKESPRHAGLPAQRTGRRIGSEWHILELATSGGKGNRAQKQTRPLECAATFVQERIIVVRVHLICCVLVGASVVTTSPVPTVGHDLKGYLVQSRQVARRTAADEVSAATTVSNLNVLIGATHLSRTRARSVIESALLWPVGHKLSICFLGGSQALRSRIVNVVTSRWPVGNITSHRLEYGSSFAASSAPLCSNPATADIKVSFLTGDDFGGYWSYVGQESLQYTPSLNLEKFTENSPAEPDFDRLVAHEFGHALGFQHEHQSPAAPTCLWNYDLIYKNYVWKSQDEMHQNLDRLTNSMNGSVPRYQYSGYDKASVMHYYFPADNFTDRDGDKCYIPGDNVEPSAQDVKGLAAAYGASLSTTQSLGVRYSGEISSILRSRFPGLAQLLQMKQYEIQNHPTNKQIIQRFSVP